MLHLDLAIPSEWPRIDQVREAVASCVDAVYSDRDLRDALAMVSAELLENAFKYGAPGPVRITLRAEDSDVVVTVTNAVAEGSTHACALQDLVSWVNGHASAEAAYAAALERAFDDRAGDCERSGLGLARISYEGGCALACDTSTPGRVTVQARAPLPKAA
jgi:hypothetical protein